MPVNFKTAAFPPMQATGTYQVFIMVVPVEVPIEDIRGLMAGFAKARGLAAEISVECLQMETNLVAGENLNVTLKKD